MRLLCGTLHFLLPGGGHPHMSRREFVMLFGRGAAADICTADEPTRNERRRAAWKPARAGPRVLVRIREPAKRASGLPGGVLGVTPNVTPNPISALAAQKRRGDIHGSRSPDPRARPSGICGYDRKIPRRPAREADQHLSYAAQRSSARRELVQSLQYGAMEDDASWAATRYRDHPHGPSRQLAIRVAPARAVAGARRRAFAQGMRCARGLARLQMLQRERARRARLCR